MIHKLTNLRQFSLEWFRYTSPALPMNLKGSSGEILIKSLQNLSELVKDKQQVTFFQFLRHFTQFPYTIERFEKDYFLLHKAVLSNDIGVLTALISSGCDLNLLDSDGYSALVVAIRENNEKATKLIQTRDSCHFINKNSNNPV